MNQSVFSDLYTIRDWARWGASWFAQAKLYFGHGTDNPWDEALVLILWAVNQSWDNLDRIIDARLTQEEKEEIMVLFERRVQERIPAAYITGEAWFANLKFTVTRDVLVPRSPIAELIGDGFEPWLQVEPDSILDMCTGSGCIGIACAYAFPEASVDLVDISDAAIHVAQQNIKQHGLSERVHAIVSDGFDKLCDSPELTNNSPERTNNCPERTNNSPELSSKSHKKYDLIVSNPPYVDLADLKSMPSEYHAEPSLGLGSGNDGLDFTRQLLPGAAKHLNDGGLLVVEVGNSWETLEAAYPAVPFVWPELENGGHGVFVLTAEQLREKIL